MLYERQMPTVEEARMDKRVFLPLILRITGESNLFSQRFVNFHNLG